MPANQLFFHFGFVFKFSLPTAFTTPFSHAHSHTDALRLEMHYNSKKWLNNGKRDT